MRKLWVLVLVLGVGCVSAPKKVRSKPPVVQAKLDPELDGELDPLTEGDFDPDADFESGKKQKEKSWWANPVR